MAKKKYVDYEGLRYYNEKLQEILDTKANSSDVTSQIATIDTKVDNTRNTLETSIGTTNTNLSNLQTTVGVSISNLQGKDTQQDTAISALQNKDGQHDSAISTLQTKDTAQDNAIASLQTADTAINNSISSLQNKDSQHDSAIASLNSTKANKTEVTQEIAAAIAGVSQFEYQVVQELPQQGTKGIIYLVPAEEAGDDDVYQEFIWIETSSTWECLGYTNNIDLSNYVTFNDTITNNEIDSLFIEKFNLLFEYDTIKSNVGYNIKLKDDVDFVEDYWNEAEPGYYVPKSNICNITLALNGTEVAVPYSDLAIEDATKDVFFNTSSELEQLIIENGGTLLGFEVTLTVNKEIFELNGAVNKARTLSFVYGQPLDGCEYPTEEPVQEPGE